MSLNRRHFLLFLGASATVAACGKLPSPSSGSNPSPAVPVGRSSTIDLGFQPVRGPMPLGQGSIKTIKDAAEQLSNYDIIDDLVLPEGFTYDVLAAWGDTLGDSRVGYNNDYLSFVPTGENEGYLTINFEYITGGTWQQTYPQVIGKALPWAEVKAAVAKASKVSGDGSALPGLDASRLPEGDPLKAQVTLIAKEALIDLGIGVMAIRRTAEGRWERTNSKADRRITGISGLEDGRYLNATGPAVAIFKKTQGQGYLDKLGDRIIGTFQNCAGGTSPWGTVLSAEENVQSQIPEEVYADGTSFDPKTRPYTHDDGDISGAANVFGLAGNKYGWMVEVDPANPDDYGTKHTWLGRYRHEAVAIRAEAGKPLAVYSGCDRKGGHLYKFISQGQISNPTDKTNSQLLEAGMLYAAQFNADGTGRWIALKPDTPVDPIQPAFHTGSMITLPQRPEGGSFPATTSEDIAAFKQAFKTLADLYSGTDGEKQGAILIDAHLAANAAGATCTARPEDTELAPDGSLFIAFTSGSLSKTDGSPDVRIFKGPNGDTGYEYGWIMKILEDNNAPDAMTFQWSMFATGGEPTAGGQGFANPDNLAFDSKGNLWMVTDISSSAINSEVLPGRQTKSGKILSSGELLGLYGNNGIWVMPTSGKAAGQAVLFGMVPMETESTGPFILPDQTTMFLSIQHPGEINGIRKDMATETRKFAMKAPDGQEFIQTRQVPIGSNWPGRQANDPPKPAIVAIRRTDNQTFTT